MHSGSSNHRAAGTRKYLIVLAVLLSCPAIDMLTISSGGSGSCTRAGKVNGGNRSSLRLFCFIVTIAYPFRQAQSGGT